MNSLLVLVFGSLVLTYFSERHIATISLNSRYRLDVPLTVMLIWICSFCGLRTAYNDTITYISGFMNAASVEQILAGDINLLGNPLYYLFVSFFRHHISDNYHLFLLFIAFFNILSTVRFIRRRGYSITFSMLLFFTLGMYLSNFAAVKQSIAMAILTYAIDSLLDKKYARFYLIIALAALFHTYAIMYAVLPLFTNKPWTKITYLTIGAMLFVLFTFESTITEFLEYADELGKDISATEVFETASINVFRLAVFSIPVLLSFAFRGRLNRNMPPVMCLMMNMSILSFLIMCLGLNSAGNLFGRSAIYFEMGTIIVLPWIIWKLFNKRSATFITAVATACYFVFFLFDTQNFADSYRAVSFSQFLETLF